MRRPTALERRPLARVLVQAYTAAPGVTGVPPAEGFLDWASAEADSAEVVVAVEGASVLGGLVYVGGYGPLLDRAPAGDAEIRWFGVAPESQRSGVGIALLRSCIGRARSEHRPRLWAATTARLAGAHPLYRGLGFCRVPALDLVLPTGEGDGTAELRAYVLEL